eukprot:COSAG02_NODE_37546_length_440_cov_1.507331_1_plen_23_part_10
MRVHTQLKSPAVSVQSIVQGPEA